MTKVTNNHDAPLNVAGVDVRPGATVEVDTGKFKKWANGGGAKVWLQQELITADTKVDTKSKAAPADPQTERQKLEAQAAGLGIAFDAETSDEDLTNAISKAQEAAQTSERETLLKEARDLGLNPNANTGTEKLKKMIADKKAQQ